mgnify:FL=1
MFLSEGETLDEVSFGSEGDTNVVALAADDIADLSESEQSKLNELFESLAADEALLNEAAATALTESPRIIRKKSSIKAQRVNYAALMLAKANSDPLYDKLKLHLTKFREIRNVLREKYAAKAKALATQPVQK